MKPGILRRFTMTCSRSEPEFGRSKTKVREPRDSIISFSRSTFLTNVLNVPNHIFLYVQRNKILIRLKIPPLLSRDMVRLRTRLDHVRTVGPKDYVLTTIEPKDRG